MRKVLATVGIGLGALGVGAVLPVGAQEDPPPATAEHQRPARRPALREAFRIAAETIGVEPSELREALRDGKSIADVAEEHGVDPQAVIDAIVAKAAERAEKFVNFTHP